MNFWNQPTVGVIVGGAIVTCTQIGTQFWTNRREVRQRSRAVTAQAEADRKALQIRTLADLQEQIEAVSVAVGTAIAEPVKLPTLKAMFGGGSKSIPDLTSFSRALMLCSRLDDRELAETARTWLKELRVVCSTAPFDQDAYYALRDRRIVFQDRLGEKLLSFYE